MPKMPETLGFDLLHFCYVLSAALIVGGGFALGSAAAPTLFKELDRGQAGTVFGAILERWDGVAVLAGLVLVATTALRAVGFESGDPLLLRWVAVLVALVATLYASAWANPIARQLRRQTRDFDDLPPSAPERREFARYHSRSRAVTSVAILAGLVALWLS